VEIKAAVKTAPKQIALQNTQIASLKEMGHAGDSPDYSRVARGQ
jgi:hypothetical protein